MRPRYNNPALVLLALTATFFGPHQPAARAAVPDQAADHALLLQLAARLDADDAKIAADHATIANLQAKLATTQAATSAASSTSYGPFTVSGKDVYLTGYNLHIQSGSGSTTATPNGYGNLIIGYNEAPSSPKRTGSHNLILGTDNNYTSYGGIVAGNANTISGIYASVVGGRSGTASGSYSCIAGGYKNTTSTIYTVAAGPMNTTALTTQGNDGNDHSGYLVTFTGANVQIINGLGATDGEPNNPEDVTNYVTNGLGNLIIGYNETQASLGKGATDTRTGSHDLILGDYNEWANFGGMIGGSFNTNESPYGGILTGSFNTVSDADTAIVGGNYNEVSAIYGVVLGGYENLADGASSAIVAGENNITLANNAVLVGGNGNYAYAADSSVLGGYENNAIGTDSCISGGDSNDARGDYSSVTGGYGNTATAQYSTVSGGYRENETNEYYWEGGTYESQ